MSIFLVPPVHSHQLFYLAFDRRKTVGRPVGHLQHIPGKLASLNRSWQSKEGTYRALGMAGIEPTPSKSECDWTPLSPLTTWPRGRYQIIIIKLNFIEKQSEFPSQLVLCFISEPANQYVHVCKFIISMCMYWDFRYMHIQVFYIMYVCSYVYVLYVCVCI